MLLTYLGRTIKLGLNNFRRNFWLSLVTIVILLLTLFSITILATLNIVGKEAISIVKDKVDMDVYFKVGVKEENVLETKSFLEKNSKVDEITYTSPAQALENFKEKFKDNPTILQSLGEFTENPLPASLTVKANELDEYQSIMSSLDGSEFSSIIEKKNYQNNQDVIDKINNITSRIYQIGMAVSGVFALISLLVVFNTFRLAIYALRDEISIMKLVGATNSFIRAPFLFESLIYSVATTALAMAIFYPLVIVAAPYINNFFEGYSFNLVAVFADYFWNILGLQFLCALIISALSSLFAVGRYLKV